MKVPKCFYCLNCPEFDELILRKIVRIVATRTRCQIFTLKCTKFNFGWGSTPDPARGAYRIEERGEKRKEGERGGGGGSLDNIHHRWTPLCDVVQV